MTWRDDAHCQTIPGTPKQRLDLFFPLSGRDCAYDAARRVCAACEVRAECLVDAMRRERNSYRFGMQGGLTPEERADLARRLCPGCGERAPAPRRIYCSTCWASPAVRSARTQSA